MRPLDPDKVRELFKNVTIVADPSESVEADSQFLCSACFEGKSIDELHVLPCWNETGEMFVTSYRCNECWEMSLLQTRSRLTRPDMQTKEVFVFFLRNYQQNALADAYLSASPAEADKLAANFLDTLELNPKILFTDPRKIRDFFRPHLSD